MVSTKRFRFSERAIAFIQVGVLAFVAIAPVLLAQTAEAAQLGQRSISMSSSLAGETGVDYDVSVNFTNDSDVAGMVIAFCNESPILGDACTQPAGFDATGVTLANNTDSWAVDVNSDAQTVVLSRTTSALASTEVTLQGITNPTTTDTFYARVLSYTDAQDETAYTPGTPNAHTDDGGIALSTANQIDITARVQEQLTFCVGNADANSSNNCDDITGTGIDLGVLDPTNVNVASDTVSANTDGEGSAYARVSTNAQQGAVVQYNAGDLTDGSNVINAVGGTEASVDAGTEEWGIAVASIDTTDGTTTNLTRSTEYDNDVGYAFQPNTLTTLADSSAGAGAADRVLDNEQLVIDFAASVSATTPTGLYETTFSFIATGTF